MNGEITSVLFYSVSLQFLSFLSATLSFRLREDFSSPVGSNPHVEANYRELSIAILITGVSAVCPLLGSNQSKLKCIFGMFKGYKNVLNAKYFELLGRELDH